MTSMNTHKHGMTTLWTILFALVVSASIAGSVEAAGNASVTLTWTAPGDDGSTGTAAVYDIRYSTSPINEANWNSATQVTGEPAPQAAGSSESVTVTGLEWSTTYYFAIKAADEADNWSALSNVASFTTAPDEVPPSAVTDLQASTGTSSGQVVIHWTAPGDDGSDGIAAAYDIRYDTDSITSATWNSATMFTSAPEPAGAGAAESAVISGLTPGTLYYIGIITYDDANNPSGLSNVSSAEAYFEFSTDIDDDDNASLPTHFSLAQNYPNPFNPTTQIDYAVPQRSNVRIDVFNVQGQLVRTLVDEMKAPGFHSVEWDGRDNGNTDVASGIYFYRIAAGDFHESRKMVMLK